MRTTFPPAAQRRHAAAARLGGGNEQRHRSMNLGLTPPGYDMPPLRGWEGGMRSVVAP